MPEFKASAILYSSSVTLLFFGMIIPLMDMISRHPITKVDTIIELFELNPFSQLGFICFVLGLFLFWLGLMVDRRGA